MRWFTADTHFYHEKVMHFGKRPWTTMDEMHEGLIKRWNERVGNKDECWVLGDFAFRNKVGDDLGAIFHRLNGKKHLIVGNHDNKAVLELPWTSVDNYKEISVDGSNVIMSHYPMRSWNKMFHGSYHLYGHEHSNVRDYSHHNSNVGKGGSCDVGSDCWEWYPVSFPEIVDRIIKTGVANPDLLHKVTGADRTRKKTDIAVAV
jgi:calcineurin-like phosphoesterase family protein